MQLLDEVARILYLAFELGGSRIEMSHEHWHLVDALAAGDGDAAARAVADQINGVERLIMATAPTARRSPD